MSFQKMIIDAMNKLKLVSLKPSQILTFLASNKLLSHFLDLKMLVFLLPYSLFSNALREFQSWESCICLFVDNAQDCRLFNVSGEFGT